MRSAGCLALERSQRDDEGVCMKHARISALSVLVAVALTGVSGEAIAASFRYEPGGAIRLSSEGKASFRTALFTLECDWRMSGELARTLVAKSAGQEFGRITRAEVDGCINLDRNLEVLRLPWTLKYNAITGTLPEEVTGVLLTIASIGFLFEFSGVRCLYSGVWGGMIAVTASSGGRYNVGRGELALEETVGSGDVLVNQFFCPRAGRFSGRFNIAPTQELLRL